MGYYQNTLRYRKTSSSITITKYKSCDGCTEVEIPSTIEGLPVTKIDGWVFSECSHLTKVIIPPSVTEIGPSAFHGCHGLADEQGFVIVGGVLYDYIGDGGLVTVPEGVHEIGVSAFYQCQTLTRVISPQSLRVIRGRAFFGCESLKSINIPNGMERIVFWAFKNCYGLADAEGLIIVGGILFNYIGTKDSIILPDHVTEIEEGAFWDPIKETLNMPKVQSSDGRILTEEELRNGCKLQKRSDLP